MSQSKAISQGCFGCIFLTLPRTQSNLCHGNSNKTFLKTKINVINDEPFSSQSGGFIPHQRFCRFSRQTFLLVVVNNERNISYDFAKRAYIIKTTQISNYLARRLACLPQTKILKGRRLFFMLSNLVAESRHTQKYNFQYSEFHLVLPLFVIVVCLFLRPK